MLGGGGGGGGVLEGETNQGYCCTQYIGDIGSSVCPSILKNVPGLSMHH